MTSQGHAYSRFRRALLTGNVMIIEAAARELPQIELEDALRILAVLAEKRDHRFDRAAARFAGRLVTERNLNLAQGHHVLALAASMPTAPDATLTLLRTYCERPGLRSRS